MPRDQIDVQGALDAYRQSRYPNTASTMVRPLDSLDDMRTLLRPFKKEA